MYFAAKTFYVTFALHYVQVGDAVAEARQLKELGKLSEKQEKALEKIEKKMQKIAHLREEVRTHAGNHCIKVVCQLVATLTANLDSAEFFSVKLCRL